MNPHFTFEGGQVAEWVRSLNFSTLNHSIISPSAVAGVGSNSALVICGTSQVLLANVSGGFPGVLPFCPTNRLARLDMSEIILNPKYYLVRVEI